MYTTLLDFIIATVSDDPPRSFTSIAESLHVISHGGRFQKSKTSNTIIPDGELMVAHITATQCPLHSRFRDEVLYYYTFLNTKTHFIYNFHTSTGTVFYPRPLVIVVNC